MIFSWHHSVSWQWSMSDAEISCPLQGGVSQPAVHYRSAAPWHITLRYLHISFACNVRSSPLDEKSLDTLGLLKTLSWTNAQLAISNLRWSKSVATFTFSINSITLTETGVGGHGPGEGADLPCVLVLPQTLQLGKLTGRADECAQALRRERRSEVTSHLGAPSVTCQCLTLFHTFKRLMLSFGED